MLAAFISISVMIDTKKDRFHKERGKWGRGHITQITVLLGRLNVGGGGIELHLDYWDLTTSKQLV